MAMTGSFLADFSAFVTECMKADEGLGKMQLSAERAEKQIDRLTKSFSGQRVVEESAAMMEAVERIGGSAKLTEAEFQKVAQKAAEASAKLRAMGEDVPPLMQAWAAGAKQAEGGMTNLLGTVKSLAGVVGVSLSAGALVSGLVNMGKSALATADNLVTLSDATGMSVEEVQRLSYVATQGGATLDDFTKASGRLNANLGDAKIQDALRDLRINVESFSNTKPYQQIELIADAFEALPPGTDKARIAQDLFGQSWQKLYPALISGYKDVAREATIAADAQVRGLKDASDAWTKFKAHVDTTAVGVLGTLVRVGQQVGKQGLFATIGDAARTKDLPTLIARLYAGAQAEKAWNDEKAKRPSGDAGAVPAPPPVSAMAAYRAELDRLRDSYTALTPAQMKVIEDAYALNQTATQIATGLKTVSVDAVQNYINSLKEQEQQQKRTAEEGKRAAEELAKAHTEIASAGLTSKDTLAGINAEVANSIKYYLDAGVSQSALATAYGLTATQVRSVAEALKEEQKILKQEDESIETVRGLWRELNDEKLQRSGTTTDKLLADFTRWYQTESDKLKTAGGNWVTHYAALEAVAQEKLDAIMVNWSEVATFSQAKLQDTADRAQATYTHVLQHSERFRAGAVAHFENLAARAADALDGISADWDALDKTSISTLEHQAQVAEETYQRALDASNDQTAAAIENYRKQAEAARAAYNAAQGLAPAAEEGMGAIEEGAERAKRRVDETTESTRQLSVQMQNLGGQARATVGEMHALAIQNDNLYRAAGIFVNDVGGAASTYWYRAEEAERMRRYLGAGTGAELGYRENVGPAWGTGAGATQTSNVLNVNVNNADAREIARTLTDEMRHQGYRF